VLFNDFYLNMTNKTWEDLKIPMDPEIVYDEFEIIPFRSAQLILAKRSVQETHLNISTWQLWLSPESSTPMCHFFVVKATLDFSPMRWLGATSCRKAENETRAAKTKCMVGWTSHEEGHTNAAF